MMKQSGERIKAVRRFMSLIVYQFRVDDFVRLFSVCDYRQSVCCRFVYLAQMRV
jgi:hypothetical protein